MESERNFAKEFYLSRTPEERMRMLLSRCKAMGKFVIDNGKIHVFSDMWNRYNAKDSIGAEDGYEITEVDGDFIVEHCAFTTMKGWPRVINGDLKIIDCPLRIPPDDILQYSPDEVKGQIQIVNSPLIDIKSIIRSCKCDVKKIYVDQR